MCAQQTRPTPPDGRGDGGSSDDQSASLPSAVFHSVQGGLFATAVMTAFRLPILRSLPPTANFWAKYVGDGDPEEYRTIGLLLHLVYGAVGGLLFGLGYGRLNLTPGENTEARGVVWGALYGLVLSVFGEYAMLRGLLGMDVEEEAATVFHTSHLIYGLALGAWVGSRTGGDPEEEYEEYEETQ
jgi:hypothetical protein